ncbi:hypothetical protein AADG42_02920 [Ammonicoccus fulvus]|uniref:Uncharacterized protein n=1 Tax=Ammonicoccus fulvus TaxID=3138240 RepID=A0ABZ3FJT9_9ACTN
MTKPNPLDALQQGLADLTAADGTIARITAARTVRAAAEQLEHVEVKRAREHGTSWSKIGAVYGLTKQGAQQRFAEERRKKSDSKASESKTAESKTSDPKQPGDTPT